MSRRERPDIEPRGLRRPQAAAYVGVSPSQFDKMVSDGRMPMPKQVDGCVIWDRIRLDESFEALPDKKVDRLAKWRNVA